MAESTSTAELLHRANVRLCQVCLWTNYDGFGFHLKISSHPPQIINIVESNSPAAAGGLNIWDVILAVNHEDTSKRDYNQVYKIIKTACDTYAYVELLVVEQKYYKTLKEKNIPIDYSLITAISTPSKMPAYFVNFQRLKPRICNLRLGRNDTKFGFDIVNGENDIGAYIQTIFPDSPASDAGLRKFDRIIEIDDRNVEKSSSDYIDKKLNKANGKGTIKLFVADTHTYEYYNKNNIKFRSTESQTAENKMKNKDSISQRISQFFSSFKKNTKQHNANDQIADNNRYYQDTRNDYYDNFKSSYNKTRDEDLEDSAYSSQRLYRHRIDDSRSDYPVTTDHDFGSTYKFKKEDIRDDYSTDVKYDHHSTTNFQPDDNISVCASTLSNHSLKLYKRQHRETISDDSRSSSYDHYKLSQPSMNDTSHPFSGRFTSNFGQADKFQRKTSCSTRLATANHLPRSSSAFHIADTKLDTDSDHLRKALPLQTSTIKRPSKNSLCDTAERTPIAKNTYPRLQYRSLTDLRKSNQTTEPSLPETSDIVTASNGTIRVCRGDITKQQVDAIVIASTSNSLRKNVLQEAGDSIRTTYNTEWQRKKDSSIYTNGGDLSCKRIYFIPAPQLSRNADRWTFRKFVTEAIRMATNDRSTKIQSIAFPAIGCGQCHCDSTFVAKTLIMAVAYELEHQLSLQLDVYFVIEQSQPTIFNTFRNQLLAFKSSGATSQTKPSSTPSVALPPKVPRNPPNKKRFVIEKRLLTKSSSDYNMVLKEFNSTMTPTHYKEIIRIELVWNERWYKQYRIHKDEFSQRLQTNTEKQLFHGCSETAANNIIKECFNRSYAGIHGVVYGCGVYFSSRASYSHTYAIPNTKGERCMFLAKVLIGKTIVGNSSMKIRPVGYDTTTNGSHIYVTYHDAQAFGQYLITYK